MDLYAMKNSEAKKNFLVFGSLALSLYFVIAVWNFWSDFIFALGFNATILFLGIIALFLYSKRISSWRDHSLWIIPLVFISLSFSLWENPFLKIISILILPFLLSIVFRCALSTEKTISIKILLLSISERFSLISKIQEAIRLILSVKNKEQETFLKIILGSFLFLILALTVFIPLLSAADPQFGELMKGITDFFSNILSFRYMDRIVFAMFFTILLISYFLSFKEKYTPEESSLIKKANLDSIVSGIVLGGVLVLYLIFIGMQLPRLWINQLPFDFRQTEQLVKSGFWQLFILSIINIVFFLGYFRKTIPALQSVLKVFTIASFLLLLSAGHRMFLYVFFYGFSYEKFFASYTVIYCVLLFLWLARQLFANRERNLFQYLFFSALWMYSIATILPIERFIFSLNANLSKNAQSRIKMQELQMLSYDVLPLAATYRKDAQWQKDWCFWANREIHRVGKKEWYEKNMANFSTTKIPVEWKTWECRPEEE